MKKLSVIVMLICIACSSKQRVHDFIPGVYARHIQNEYSVGCDTLLISKENENTKTYTILRTTSYQRVIKGELKPVERKIEQWIALYNEEKKVLLEQKKGKIISFIPEKNQLLVGSNAYQKIK